MRASNALVERCEVSCSLGQGIVVRALVCVQCAVTLETASTLSSSESELAGAAHMWVPLPAFAYHFETGAVFSECCDAQCLARLSQTCQFGMLLNPIPGDFAEQFF